MAEEIKPIKTILSQVSQYRHNPSAIQRVVYDHLRAITDGRVNIVDPTTPFNMLLESACVLTSSYLSEAETLLRKQYPSMATTLEDLYLHMSDVDYINRFAIPAKARFHLWIDLQEMISKMILDPNTGIKTITIPANSEFTINDITFSLQYPIDIKQLTHGGWQVTYNTSSTSPLQELSTNRVEWSIDTITKTQQEIMHLEFDVTQFSIASYQSDIPASTGYNRVHPFTDQYYWARVYYKNSNTGGRWKEIKTTHTEQVYDPTDPTACLKVLGDELMVAIPQLYLNTSQVSGSLRVDIYQTKGPINLLLENYKPDSFTANFLQIDKSSISPEVAAFKSIASVFAYAKDPVSGGRDAIDFDTLRRRVIMNTVGQKSIPITNVQIETALENSGFSIVKNVDVITNRQYLATRSLPRPFDDNLITSASCSIETMIASMDELKKHGMVVDHGDMITIVPSMLFENTNSQVTAITVAETNSILSKSSEEIADIVNERHFCFTPFHYVLDASSDYFEMRPYYMDKPESSVCRFKRHNDTTGLQVNTSEFKLIRTSSGYKLYVQTVSSQAYKALHDSLVHVQLGYKPHGSASLAMINGRLVNVDSDGERIFEFDIDTSFDIDKKHLLTINNFTVGTSTSVDTKSQLSQEFFIYYSASSTMPSGWSSYTEDSELARQLLPNTTAFITKEAVTLTFGKYLNSLWAAARTIVAGTSYKRYTTDIPKVYHEDIYQRDPNTGSIFSIDANGNIVYKKLHSQGDPVLDSNGKPMLEHKAGDIMLDDHHRPIPVNPRAVSRQLDLLFIEGGYYFSTDSATLTYKQSVIDTMVTWITQDIEKISEQLLEQTRVFYYPQANMGSIRVMTDSGAITNLFANQSFHVKLYVNKDTHSSITLRQDLIKSTIKTIDKHLDNSTVSVSALTDMLKDTYGNDVIAFDVSGFGTGQDVQLCSILNEGERFAINKKLYAQPDGKLIVVEDVTVDFILHSQ